ADTLRAGVAAGLRPRDGFSGVVLRPRQSATAGDRAAGEGGGKGSGSDDPRAPRGRLPELIEEGAGGGCLPAGAGCALSGAQAAGEAPGNAETWGPAQKAFPPPPPTPKGPPPPMPDTPEGFSHPKNARAPFC